MRNLVFNIINEKCPFCRKGDVYLKGKLYLLPEMNSECPACKRDLVGEPGYYFGAMYVSYGIAVLTGIITFLICKLIFKIDSPNQIIGIIIFVIILISVKNFKWSRIIWLKIFPPGANTKFEDKGKA